LFLAAGSRDELAFRWPGAAVCPYGLGDTACTIGATI
jgi:hypothetical protein